MEWIKAAAFALSLTTGWAGGAAADVVLSTSNAPDPVAEALDDVAPASRLELASVRPKPRPKGLRVRYDRDFVAALPAPAGGEQWRCLAEALYFEARGEDVRGIFAVAEVILNRVESDGFPDTVCSVVNQGTGERYRCQFTYTCDGLAEAVHEPGAYRMVGKVARLMLDGAARPLTEGATHYHTRQVNPRWASVFPRTSTIGFHHFYRMPG